jgi:hypothetical protein
VSFTLRFLVAAWPSAGPGPVRGGFTYRQHFDTPEAAEAAKAARRDANPGEIVTVVEEYDTTGDPV